MNADRSQLGNKGPEEDQQPTSGVRDARSIPPTRPALPTTLASRDLLFGRICLATGFIDQENFDNAIVQQQTAPFRSLANILVQIGSLSEEERRSIGELCEKHAARHDDDPQQSLAALTMAPTVFHRQPPGMDMATTSLGHRDGK